MVSALFGFGFFKILDHSSTPIFTQHGFHLGDGQPIPSIGSNCPFFLTAFNIDLGLTPIFIGSKPLLKEALKRADITLEIDWLIRGCLKIYFLTPKNSMMKVYQTHMGDCYDSFSNPINLQTSKR